MKPYDRLKMLYPHLKGVHTQGLLAMQKTGRKHIWPQKTNLRNTGSLEIAEQKSENYFIKIFTNAIESRDVIRKKKPLHLSASKLTRKAKWAHSN